MDQSSQSAFHRSFSMPFGTSILPAGGILFRLWAPAAEQVDLCLLTGPESMQIEPMVPQPDGWFICRQPAAAAGQQYRFRINRQTLVPDPASRCQVQDIHGPSLICDPKAFCWQDTDWQGRPWEEAVIYEIHVGTFSPQGTFAGVTERLDYLAGLGITAIELMPVAEFPGKYDWGYDGALLFAPSHNYGRPEDLKELVQAAHQKGLMVFLDVVYNHFGPEGNYLYVYAREAFFTETLQTPWGPALNFSGPHSRTVRDFFIANALYWLEEFHCDGLRLDAAHAVFDRSRPDILEEIALAVRQGPARHRQIHLMLENDNNCGRYLERQPDGRPLFYTAQWNDDLHHACHTLLTGESTGYYSDYADNPIRHLGRALTEGFAYQGEISAYRNGRARGEPSGHLPPTAFVSFLQNHDQVGNRAFGERLVTLCGQHDLLLATALLLLAPSPPLLFMGEEFGTTHPFYFFCNFGPELAESVTAGRKRDLAKLSQGNAPADRKHLPDPNAEDTFLSSRLDWLPVEAAAANTLLGHYRHLLSLRRREIVPRLRGIQGGNAGYQILAEKALLAWWILGDGSRLQVVFNLHPHHVDLPVRETGRLLHRFPESGALSRTSGKFPPKSIAWFLGTGEVNHGE